MADLNYTKGKWEIEGCNIQTANGRTIALAYDPDRPYHETPIALANARLIAAAPDMYKALKEIITDLEGWNKYDQRFLEKGKQALAKAGDKEEK